MAVGLVVGPLEPIKPATGFRPINSYPGKLVIDPTKLILSLAMLFQYVLRRQLWYISGQIYNMDTVFAIRVGRILNEIGHWKQWNQREPIHMIVDPKSWPKYDEMNPSSGRSKKKKRSKRIAGKL